MAAPEKTLGEAEATSIRYPNPDSKSADLFTRAQRVLTDGGSRTTIRIAPYSIYAAEAHGKYVTDVDGNRLMDFNYNYTSMIHGHSASGRGCGSSGAGEKKAADSLSAARSNLRWPSCFATRCENLDKIRFTNSGTEAVMKSIKAARAYTGRPKNRQMRKTPITALTISRK